VESNQIDPFAFPMLRNFEQIDDAEETRLPRQLRSDIRKTDRLDRVNLDLAFFHWVLAADSDVRPHPYSDAAGDLSPANTLAKTLGEHHEKSLHPMGALAPYSSGSTFTIEAP